MQDALIQKRRRIWVTAIVAAAAAAPVVFSAAVFSLGGFQKRPLGVLGEVPDFSLAAADGRRVARADLAGRVWIAGFIFTRCGGQCPAMVSVLRRLESKLGERVNFLALTADPGFDSPEVLAAYAKRSGADSPRWLFLTGPADTLGSVARAFGMPAGEPMMHSLNFVLIDRRGRVRGRYDWQDTERLRALSRDAAALAAGA